MDSVPCSHVIQVSPNGYILYMVIVNVVYMQVFINFQGPTLKHVHMLKLIS